MRWIAGAEGAPDRPYDADVIILTLDRAPESVAAIASALAQTGLSRHVFVVDQGSCPDALTRIAGAVHGRSDATLVSLDRNHGVAGGRNRGSALGHGRVIAVIDNDAEFATPETLRQLVDTLDADRSVGAVGCRIVMYDGGGDDLLSWGYPLGLLPHAAKSFDTATFVGAGHAIRRAAWNDAGGYDEALFFCWEEYDFALRAMAQGWRIRYCGDLVVRHKLAPEGRVAWAGKRWFYFVRNRLYIGRKYGAGWLALTPRALGYVLKGAHNGLAWTTLRAIVAAERMSRSLPYPPMQIRGCAPEGAHRGSWAMRLRREVFAPLPGLSRLRSRRSSSPQSCGTQPEAIESLSGTEASSEPNSWLPWPSCVGRTALSVLKEAARKLPDYGQKPAEQPVEVRDRLIQPLDVPH